MKIQEEILKLKKENKAGAIATVTKTIGRTPQKVGAKMLIREDGSILGTVGGGIIEKVTIEEALKVIKEGEPRLITRDLDKQLATCCGGTMDIFIEPINPLAKLIIFGAGHVAFETSQLASKLGFKTLLIDEREDLANKERLPWVAEIHNRFDKDALDKIDFSDAYVAILTHDHKIDEGLLAYSLKKTVKYLGMLGSELKVKKAYLRLKSQGFKEEEFKKIHAPIGLKIGSVSPEEIAVSILAELIKVKNEK